MRGGRRLVLTFACLGAAIVAPACASAPKKPTLAELESARARALADARLLEGCYDCLIEARDIYERLAVGAARPAHLLALFETQLLIALREKELAIDSSAAIDRAMTIGAELPAPVDAGRYVAIVRAMPPDGSGVPRSADLEFRQSQQAFIKQIPEHQAWLAAGTLRPAVRDYLSLSLECKYKAQPQPKIAPDAPPLLVYRHAACDELLREPLADVRAQNPAFVEAAYFLGLIEVAGAQRTGAPAARPLLAASIERFPTSASILYLSGHYNQTIGDCESALPFYERLLALEPRHEMGLLGRTICLASANRTDEAFATATQLIEWNTFNMNEAHYWRSWIWYLRKDLPAARREINLAKSLGPTRDIYRLAGIIEHDQDELALAKADLFSAIRSTDGYNDCIARWYLGMVAFKEQKWFEAGLAMEDAMACYQRVRTYSETAQRTIERRIDLDPVFQKKQLAALAATIEQCRSQYHAGAFNGASYYARAGNLDKAKSLLNVAAQDPALDARVAELRKAIGGG